MKSCYPIFARLMLGLSLLVSAACTKDAVTDGVSLDGSISPTRAYSPKSPLVAAYVDPLTTNPLNAGLYRVGNDPFFDVMQLYACDIVFDKYNDVKLSVDEDLAAILENRDAYIRPLQSQGSSVLLSVRSRDDGHGFCDQTEPMAEKFAEILSYAVKTYDLDGIDFYEPMGSAGNRAESVADSFSNIVLKLRSKLDAKFPDVHKLITLTDVSCAKELSTEAAGALDFAWSRVSSGAAFTENSLVPGLSTGKWAPLSIRLDYALSASQNTIIKARTKSMLGKGYGAIITQYLQPHTEVDPIGAFQAIAAGAGWEQTVVRDDPATVYGRDWTPAAEKLVITYEDTLVTEPEPDDPELGNQTPLDSTRFIRAVYVPLESNPLNAGAYSLSDGSPFFDLVCLDYGWFWEMSDCLPDLEIAADSPVRNYERYVKPLQDRGIKVLLNVKSGYGRWGFGNLSDALVEDLSDQIRDAVIAYKLNGVNLIDLEADYEDVFQPRPNETSYSRMVLALRKKLSDRRVITVREAGYSTTLTPEAVQAIHYMWPFSYGLNYFSKPTAPVLPNRKWAPQQIDASTKRGDGPNGVIKRYTTRAVGEGMGAISFYRLDTVDISGSLTAVAQSIYGDSVTVSRTTVYAGE